MNEHDATRRATSRQLTGCAVDEHGRTVPCDNEIKPRVVAIERSHRSGHHDAADELARITERIMRTHLAEIDGCGA